MRERSIESRLKKEVEKRGGKALKFESPGMRGVPDRIVLLPGAIAIFVELKASGQTLAPLQVKRVAELRELDFKVYCIDSLEGINRFIVEVFGK